MLKKLRSRYPVDVPAEGFGRSKGLLAIIGGLAVLAVLIPLGLAIVEGALTGPMTIAIGFGTLVLVLLFLSAMGAKPGYRGGDARGFRR